MKNTDPRSIHETVLKDIMDIWDDLKNLDADDFTDKNKPMKGQTSIAKASSALNLVFPVICSRAISIENASMISKAVEKNAVTMLQRMFTAWQIDRSGDVNSVYDYIAQFHSNLSSKAFNLDDLFRLTESGIDVKVNGVELAKIKSDLRNTDFYLPTSINETAISNFIVREGAVTTGSTDTDDKNKPADKDGAAGRKDKETSSMKNSAEFFNKQVLNSEYKKANELMPTTMVINFKVVTNNTSNPVEYDSAVVGVKAKLYPINSEDVVSHISDKTVDKNWFTNFFRATTREISFMKDFVLALDKAKIDALSLSTRKGTSDKMWKVLERRALVSRLKKALRQSNNSAAAITTLCISQEEVEYLRKNYNVDIEKIPVILNLFDSLNLMCVCIVDESLEVAKFIYDEESPMWETISFTHLERESSDNTYKRVVNLMTKLS